MTFPTWFDFGSNTILDHISGYMWFMMAFGFWKHFLLFYDILWPIAGGWGVFDLKGWNYSRGLSPPFMGQNNFPTKQDNNLKFDKFNGWPFPRGLIMDPTPFWIIYVVKCDLWWFWKHFFAILWYFRAHFLVDGVICYWSSVFDPLTRFWLRGQAIDTVPSQPWEL